MNQRQRTTKIKGLQEDVMLLTILAQKHQRQQQKQYNQLVSYQELQLRQKKQTLQTLIDTTVNLMAQRNNLQSQRSHLNLTYIAIANQTRLITMQNILLQHQQSQRRQVNQFSQHIEKQQEQKELQMLKQNRRLQDLLENKKNLVQNFLKNQNENDVDLSDQIQYRHANKSCRKRFLSRQILQRVAITQFFKTPLKAFQFYMWCDLEILSLPYMSITQKQIRKILRNVSPQSIHTISMPYNQISFHSNLEYPLFDMKRLQIINLAGNKISFIPEKMSCLKSLEVVDLSKNQINIIPPNFLIMQALKIVNLSQNLIQQFPLCLRQSNIEDLDITCNKFDKIPPKMLDMPKLKKFNISIEKKEKNDSKISEELMKKGVQVYVWQKKKKSKTVIQFKL